MSGHSHWAGIRHHKGVNDAKRAALFTKVGRAIILAAERGGGNPETNFALKLTIDQARAVNMPKDNVERAIKRGTGELKDGGRIEACLYEAYWPFRSQTKGGEPGNAALLIEAATDNKNRTVSEIKNILTKGSGKFVPTGAVSFLFNRVGLITFSLETYAADVLETAVLESDADDFFMTPKVFVVVTALDALQSVETYFCGNHLICESAELGYVPSQTVALPTTDKEAFEKLFEALNDHPDVRRVWDNLE